MDVVVGPNARETFSPRELAAAYTEFLERGPQYLDAETGITASAYRSGERVLIVYRESEIDVMVLTAGCIDTDLPPDDATSANQTRTSPGSRMPIMRYGSRSLKPAVIHPTS